MLTTLIASYALAAAGTASVSASTVSAPAEQPAHHAAQLRYDNRQRPVIATQINGSGPYFMVVDTAAEASFLVPKMGEILSLPALESDMTIRGATGVSKVNFFPVDTFSSELFSYTSMVIFELPNPGSTPAAGIIGMDIFQDSALAFHTATGELSTAPSGSFSHDSKHFLPVDALSHDGLSMKVTVKLNGVEIPATIDTGAAATIANPAAMKALGWHADDEHLKDDGAIHGATTDAVAIKRATVDSLALGPVTLRDIPVRFTMQEDNRPASLTLGVDLLNALNGFVLDFPAGKFYIMLPETESRQSTSNLL